MMKKWLMFIIALVLFLFIHEGLHVITGVIFNEFETVRWNVIGPEVIFKTPVNERHGVQWAFISGVSNLATILLGYILLSVREKFVDIQNNFVRGGFYYFVIALLLFDPFNLSIAPFFIGGDVFGIAEGLNISPYILQFVFFIILLLNRELIAQKLVPAFDVKTKHPLLRPWINLGGFGK